MALIATLFSVTINTMKIIKEPIMTYSLSKLLVTTCSLLLLFGCTTKSPSSVTESPLTENMIVAYFDNEGNPATKPEINGSYRKILKIQSDGSYLVQSFFTNNYKKQTDPITIQNKADLKMIDPISLDGKFTQWYQNGQQAGTGTFVKGKRVGQFTEWNENGNKMTEMFFVNDTPDGPASLWYENGQLYIMGQFKEGKEQGDWTVWQDDGQQKYTVTFNNGEIVTAKDANNLPVKITKDDLGE